MHRGDSRCFIRLSFFAKMEAGKESSMDADINLYRRIVEQESEAVIFADCDGLIQIWNKGAEDVFGFSWQEVAGKSLDMIIPETLRERHWKAYDKAMATGVLEQGSRVMPTRALHKDGRVLYIDLSFAIIKDDSGQVKGSLGIGRDMTEQYLSGKAQKKYIAELEKKLSEQPGTVV
jgi:PAS domain S-box-containing protein